MQLSSDHIRGLAAKARALSDSVLVALTLDHLLGESAAPRAASPLRHDSDLVPDGEWADPDAPHLGGVGPSGNGKRAAHEAQFVAFVTKNPGHTLHGMAKRAFGSGLGAFLAIESAESAVRHGLVSERSMRYCPKGAK